MQNKPYAASCDQNREPIQQVLQRFVKGRHSVLEIGSGTGQHAVYFSALYPWLNWQPSDLAEYHAGIQAWIDDSHLPNVRQPIELNVGGEWPDSQYDLLYSANTAHIMSSELVEHMLQRSSSCMHADSVMLLYGPFNYQGQYTSDSNAEFDSWLKQRDADSGIKNFEWLQDIAGVSGLKCTEDIAMPANNRLLIWQKETR